MLSEIFIRLGPTGPGILVVNYPDTKRTKAGYKVQFEFATKLVKDHEVGVPVWDNHGDNYCKVWCWTEEVDVRSAKLLEAFRGRVDKTLMEYQQLKNSLSQDAHTGTVEVRKATDEENKAFRKQVLASLQ